MKIIEPAKTNKSLIAHDQTHSYLNNLWNKDYGLGLYFSAMQELGDELLIPFIVEENGVEKWYFAHHALYDGTSALRELNQVVGLELKTTDQIAFKRVKGLKWITALASALLSKPHEEHKFKNQRPLEKRTNNFQHFFHQFTPEQTLQIDSQAKAQKVSATTYFFSQVARLCTKKFSHNKVTRWMIPVSIRGQIQPAPLSDLQASYIGVNYVYEGPIKELNQQLIKKLKKGEHWGYWLISKLGLYLGKNFILYGTQKSLQKKKTLWFGSFSNVGDIGGKGDKNIVIIHPVRRHRPLGTTLYKHKNSYNIVMSVHESLEITPEELTELKNDLCQSILAK